MTTIQKFNTSVDILASLLWQHNNASALQTLLTKKQEWYDDNLDDFWQNWERDVFDLRTANAFGLKVWSIILGIPLTAVVGPTVANKPAWGFSAELPSVYTIVAAGHAPATLAVITALRRIDWQGDWLLSTAARTNGLTYSELFNGTDWLSTRASMADSFAGAMMAPDGSNNLMSKLKVDTTPAASHSMYYPNIGTYVAGNVITFSICAAVAECDEVYLQFSASGGAFGAAVGANLNLVTGAVSQVSAGVTPTATQLGTGAWRFAITATATASGAVRPITYIASSGGTGTGRVTIATANNSDGIYIWGAMLNSGALQRYVKSVATPGSIVDYSYTAAGAVTFGEPIGPYTSAKWSGSYRNNAAVTINATLKPMVLFIRTGRKNFNNGNFSSTKSASVGLTIEQQRLVLRLRYFKLISRCTTPEINRVLKYLFGQQGGAYVLDPLDMSEIIYVFNFQLDSQLIFLFQEFDLLPRPSTVGIKYQILTAPSFGFGGKRKNFNNGNYRQEVA